MWECPDYGTPPSRVQAVEAAAIAPTVWSFWRERSHSVERRVEEATAEIARSYGLSPMSFERVTTSATALRADASAPCMKPGRCEL